MALEAVKQYRPELPTGFTRKATEIAFLVTVDQAGVDLPESDDRYVYLECQFNPEQLKITKQVTWNKSQIQYMNQPDLDFGGGQAAEFSLDLLFDTTDKDPSASGRDVRKYTNLLFKLVMMWGDDVTQRQDPPRVLFKWGTFELFLAVVTKVVVTYTLFDIDGIPVRAKADVSFLQWDDEDDPEPPQNPTSRTEGRKTRMVMMGERLDNIAYEEYGHASHWRYLADVNNLHDPRALKPGQILLIPPLT
jgi:hypothetical protein